jgi:uncharacterized membrane protein
MIGFIFAILCSIFKGIQIIYNKKNAVESGEYVTSFVVRTIPIFVIIPLLIYELFSVGIPGFSSKFYFALAVSGFINIIATVLKIKAYKISDVSFVAPITAISPGLVVLTSFIVLGERVSIYGLTGISFIIIGVYFLNLRKNVSIIDPVIKLFSNIGVQLMFLVVLMYSISSSYDKVGVLETSAFIWVFSIHLLISPILFLLMIKLEDSWKSVISNNRNNLAIMGCLSGLFITFQMLSLKYILLSYTISIKRSSVLIAIILSWFMLGEKENIKMRFIGSILIVIGAIIITIIG